jgi:hypothetical protein
MKGFDCFDTVRLGMPEQLRALGYSFFARYFRRGAPHGGGRGNGLTREEAARLFDAGFWALALFQNSSNAFAYFTKENAELDAAAALAAALVHGVPAETAIYVAADYNAAPTELQRIADYFKVINEAFHKVGYKVGVYGSGLVCRELRDLRLAQKTWLANAKGWFGYREFLGKQDVLQVSHPFTLPFGLTVDNDECGSPADAGLWRPEPSHVPEAPLRKGFFARIINTIFRK